MSAIFMRNRFNIRNLRKFLLFSLSHDSKIRVTNPYVHHLVRHECLASLAHNYKATEHSNLKEKNEIPDSPAKAVDQALMEIDYNIRQVGRINIKEIEEVFSMIVDLGASSTKTHSLYLLRCCGLMLTEPPNKRVELADKIWKKLKDMGCQYDISHYNALLKVYVDNNHHFVPSEFLTTLESNNIEPNKVTFLYLMQKFCNDGDINGASEVLEFMKEKGIPIGEKVFSILITGHMNNDDVSGAKEIFDIMRSSNLSPGSESFIALACGYAKKGDFDGINSVLQVMQQNGIILSTDHYLQILSSLSSEPLTFVDKVIGLMGISIDAWRHEVLNTVLTLIDKNLCESAFKLVLAISNAEDRNHYCTNIFMKKLICSEQPLEKIVHYCDEISSRGLNEIVFMNAAKSAIDLQNFDIAVSLFKEMLKRGLPVRIQYFWPILSSMNSEKDVLSTLKTMYELGIPADFNTIFDFILPAMTSTNPDDVIQKIEATGQTRLIDPLFQHYCYHGESDKAWYLTGKGNFDILSGFNVKKFVNSHSAAIKSDPSSSFYKVLSHILNNISMSSKGRDVARGTFLAHLISLDPSVFQLFFKTGYHKDCGDINKYLDICYDILEKEAPKMLPRLRSLKNFLSNNRQTQRTHMSIEEEERELNLIKEKGDRVDFHLLQLLTIHIKEKNIDRVHQLTTELENLGFVLPPIVCTQLFNFYRQQRDLEMAGKYLKTLRENHSHFIMDTSQIIDYTLMLIKSSKTEEAVDVLKTECKELRYIGSKDFMIRSFKRLFDTVIEIGDEDLVRNVQNCLQHHSKDLNLSKLFFEPMIKMHLFRHDLNSAIEEFKSINAEHQVAPCLQMLLKRCIVSDDNVNLERVIVIASATEGRIAVLHDLFLSLFETNRTSQAIKVLENLGPKLEYSYLDKLCYRLYTDGKLSNLEEFLTVIEVIPNFDRGNLYKYLFKLYGSQNEFSKALNLYDQIEREGSCILGEEIKSLMVKICKRNNIALPSTFLVRDENKTEAVNVSATRIVDTSADELHDLLEKGDAIQALEKLESMKKGYIRTVPFYDITQLISLVVDKNIVHVLSENVQAMSYIIENGNDILCPLYARYSDAGDIESMNRLVSFIPDFCLKKTSFNGFMCKAYLKSGKAANLLATMENRLDQKNKVYSSVSFLELLSFPDLRDRAINLAKKYMDVRFEAPISVVWAYYLINENYDAADELEKNYPVQADKVDSIVLRAIKQTENLIIAKKYVDGINKQNVRIRIRERAYGALLDVLVLKKMYTEATDIVKELNSKNIDLGRHNRSTLITLKSALERENKPVPFTIPADEWITSA